MKKNVLTLVMALILVFGVQAQNITVDEIINNYFENTGGKAAWEALNGIKIKAKINQGGMEIPLEIVTLKGGKQYTSINFQGMNFMQGVYDGETLWNTNFQNMKAEKADQESTDLQKLNANDFPESLLNYQSKNYQVEFMGKEKIEGTDTYKVKLVKEPRTIDGQKVEDITYYYFDAENFVPIMQEAEIVQGPQKGNIGVTTMSDYQEVNGLFFPFSMAQGIKGGPTAPLAIESIEVNPTIDPSVFAFPEGK